MARVSATITLYMSEILYDIKNKTYLHARSAGDGGNYEAVAAMQANDDDENQNQLLRSVGNAFNSIQPKLGEYITGSSTTSNNELFGADANLTVTLSMPENYNKGDLNTVTTGIHQYLVNSAAADWFTITKPDTAASYASIAASNIIEVREALSKRNRPTRTAPSQS